ncbi:MAG: AAA family ATPase [Acidimicrobiia bacterium]
MHSGTDARTGIFGRVEQRAALERAVAAGLDGVPTLILVAGDAGIGKTTLVDLVVAGFAGTDVRVLRGFADESGSAAFSLWDGVRRGLGARVGPGAEEIEERRWEHVEVLADCLVDAGPVIVVLEDLHWADDESLWVLERLPHVLAGVPTAIVATSRDASVGRVRPNHVVALAGLDRHDVAELVGSLGGDVTEGGIGRLAELTGGNPLFVREIAIHGDRGQVPAAVGDALDWTLRDLGDDVLDVLLALALGATGVPREVLAAGVGADRGEIEARIDRALDHGVLVAGPQRQPTFRHALLAEAVRKRAGAPRCRAMHAALAAGWSASAPSPWTTAEAARHLLAAVPDADAVDAAGLASEAARGLVGAGDPGAAAELLGTAEGVVAGQVAGAAHLRATLLLERGDALEEVGAEAAASEAYEAAAANARRADDARTLARAEAGAARHLNPLEPAPETVRRLTEAADALGGDDDPLRVALLGRLAWACVAGSDVTASRRHGEEAVEIARRLGDPDLLADALVDRYFAAVDRDDVRDRSAAARELVDLGGQHRRRRVTMLGLEWQFDAFLDTGDLAAAAGVLDRFEVFAALVMSPRPRLRACILSGILILMRGDRAGALDLFDRSLEIGRGALTDRELQTMHMSLRVTASWVWGVPDTAWIETFEVVRRLDLPSTSPFYGARHAQLELMGGNEGVARALLSPLLANPDSLLRCYQGIPTLLLVGELVCDLAIGGAHVKTLTRMLEPLAGLLGIGAGLGPGVDATLGRLALLDGGPDAAVTHLRDAVAFTSSMPSPPLEARSRSYLADALDAAGDAAAAAAERAAAAEIADRIGMELQRDWTPRMVAAPDATQRRARLVRQGAGWDLEAPGGAVSVPATTGMDHLARLVGHPGREVAATDLAGMAHPEAGLGPVLDAQAKREYRRRVAELEAEVDEAREFADPYREERAREELAAVMDELRKATGLGGRDRPSGSGAERARVNVTRNLRRAIAAIGAQLPELGSHLEVSVRTGAYCSYTPEPAAAIEWVVEP